MSLPASNILSAVAALGLVLGLIWLAARGARIAGFARLPGSGPRHGRLTIQDTLALDRARRLVVVRCDGKDLLLLTGGQCDAVVGWLPSPAGDGA